MDQGRITNISRSGRNMRGTKILRIMLGSRARKGLPQKGLGLGQVTVHEWVRGSSSVPGAHRNPTGRQPAEPRAKEACAGRSRGVKSSCQYSSPSFSSNCLSASQRIVFPKSPDTRTSTDQDLWMMVSHPEPRGCCPRCAAAVVCPAGCGTLVG